MKYANIKQSYRFSRFSTDNLQQVLSWIHCEKDQVLWSGNTFSRGLSPQSFLTHLRRRDLFAYELLNQKNEIHAYAEVVIQGIDRATLCRIIVKPSHRGKGLGKFICECLISEIREWQGIEEISLNTLTSNEIAVKCYKNLGFREDGIRKKSRKIGNTWHDLVFMSMQVNDTLKNNA